MGALRILRVATDPNVLGGQYYGRGGFREFKGYPILMESSEQSHGTAVRRRLWDVTQELTGINSPV
jgi:hypothetical protein